MTEHPDFAHLLTDLVDRHGGLAASTPLQRELAGTIVQLTIDMRSSPPGELVKHAAVMEKLTTMLPPLAQKQGADFVIDANVSVVELASRYQRMVRGGESWAFSDEYLQAIALTRRLKEDCDAVLYVRNRLSPADFEAWLALLQQEASNTAVAAPGPLPLAFYADPPRPVEHNEVFYAADEVEVLPPDRASREVHPVPPEIDAPPAGPAADPRLQRAFPYLKLPPEVRAKIEGRS